MKIFLSWSGELSHKVALFFKEWLSNVFQTVELYVSSEDIEKGARWFAEVGGELEEAQFGIVCLTRENMNAPWILFEVGALAKAVNQSRVTPLLIDMSQSDLKGPLVQFQSTITNETDIKRLARTINDYSEFPLKEAQFERAFSKWWPELEQFLREAPATVAQEGSKVRERNERELLEEVLQHVRAIARSLPKETLKPKSGISKSEYSPVDVNKIKQILEDRVKPLLATVLEGAQKISINDDELRIEFAPERKHLKDILSKPENLRMLREVASEAIGKSIGVYVTVSAVSETHEEKLEAQRLRELAEQNPLVQTVLRHFRGEIVEVRGAEHKPAEPLEESFNS